jgi:hypothetical protein
VKILDRPIVNKNRERGKREKKKREKEERGKGGKKERVL